MTYLGHSSSHMLRVILFVLPLVAGLAACNTSDSVGALGCGGSVGSGINTCRSGGGGSGGTLATGGMTGTGGQKDANAAPDGAMDPPLTTDVHDLAELCTSTGGTPITGLCCSTSGDYPSSCVGSACACTPDLSHTVVKCQCPGDDTCFSPDIGCGPRTSGSGGAQGSDGSS
jgi:hypothetical protein